MQVVYEDTDQETPKKRVINNYKKLKNQKYKSDLY